MKLYGNTPEERQAYRDAYLVAKKEQGAAFDPAAFERDFLSDRYAIIPTPTKAERVTGDEIGGDGMTSDIRDVIAGIQGEIETYKLRFDIPGTFAKEKNGIVRFYDCLACACDHVVRPSRILLKEPYRQGLPIKGVLTAGGAYDANMLVQFIDICGRVCAREGLPFTRTLYMGLTGISYDYLFGDAEKLTSFSVSLGEKVLSAEFSASLSMAYGSEIGNMRNLNEREARPDRGKTDTARAVDAGSLRRLTG